jgi:hypothetical protein
MRNLWVRNIFTGPQLGQENDCVLLCISEYPFDNPNVRYRRTISFELGPSFLSEATAMQDGPWQDQRNSPARPAKFCGFKQEVCPQVGG